MNKRGRPNKTIADLRIKNVMVAFNITEWEQLNLLMDNTGISSPAIFLRACGLKAKLPAKVLVPEINKSFHNHIIEGIKTIRRMSKEQTMDDYAAGEFLTHLRFIAHHLIDTSRDSTIEIMKMEITRLKTIIENKSAHHDR